MELNEDKIVNEKAWDSRAKQQQRFTKTADREAYEKASHVLAQQAWLEGAVYGKTVLLLASGGGGQSGLFASQGAKVTVVDISSAMLLNDQALAKEKQFDIQVLHTSMDDLSALEDDFFDVVIHPVSTCYLKNISKVYSEVARVCKSGAVYISHHKQPASLQSSQFPDKKGYYLETPLDHSGPLPVVKGSMCREEGTLEYVHSWESLLGELCRAGFVIEDLVEPKHGDKKAEVGSFAHRNRFLPTFVSVKAVKKQKSVKKIII